MKKTILNFTIEPQMASQRIESLLRDLYPEVSRARWREEISAGRVKVNDKNIKAGYSVKSGDLISLEKPEEVLPGIRLEGKIEKNPVSIIHEDESMFVFDKPRKIHSVVQKIEDAPTLSDYAVLHCPEALNASPKIQDGGLVQRLDFFTSGLCIVAKKREIWEELHRQLTNHEVLKTYQALLPPGVTQEILKKAISERHFKEAKVLENKEGYSKVEISLSDGSRHVVRKIFSKIGYPLLGDTQYGGAIYKDDGFYLRCVKIDLIHPASNQKISFFTSSLVDS